MKPIIHITMVLVMLTLGSFTNCGQKEKEKAESGLQKLAKISTEKAQKTALAKTDGKIVSSELEVEDGLLLYSFDIQTADKQIMEVQINAKDGSVISSKKESAEEEEKAEGDEDKKDKEKENEDKESGNQEEEIIGSIAVHGKVNLALLAKISEADANAATLKLVEGTAVKTKLENEDGFLVYNVLVNFQNTQYEVLVDAGDGKVLAIEPEE